MDYFSDGLEGFCTALNRAETPVLFCERFDETSDIWNFSWHKHDCIELLYFLYGNAEVTAAETSVPVSFYDAVVYPSGMYHTEQLQFDHHQEIICLWVNIPELKIPNVIRIQDKDASLKWLLESIHAEYKCKDPSAVLIEHYVKTALILIFRKCFQQRIDDDPVRRVILYMQDHMAEQITVEQLSEMIYVSKSYLSRIFKKNTNMSLFEYLRMIRVEMAKTLLVSSSISINDITYLVGYNSPKYFCRAFRDCTGMSPREFKNSEEKKTAGLLLSDDKKGFKKNAPIYLSDKGDLGFMFNT